MLLAGVPLWLLQTNTYVIAPGPGGPAILVDAPPDPAGIGNLLAEHDLTPIAVLLTHGHVDHMGGIDSVANAAVRAFLHPEDLDLALHPADQLRPLFGEGVDQFPEMTVSTTFEPIEHRELLDLVGVSIDVLHTPGHTPGHCCFLVEEEGVVFTGDSLFKGSIGRTDLPGGDMGDMMTSLSDVILALDDDIAVLPGHGPTTTIAAERHTNPFLRDFQ